MRDTFAFWFDLETPPDVLFFEAIANCLKRLGHTVHTTCRKYSGVPDLAELYGIGGAIVGRHAGKNRIKKVTGGLYRSYLLAKWSKQRKIDFAVGFASRPLAVTCGLLRIPNAAVFDYEHVSIVALKRFCDWIFVPEEVSTQYLTWRGTPEGKIIKYPGLKEEVYTCVYKPYRGLLKSIGCDEKKVIVTIRPPATKAHYHDGVSEIICERILERISVDSSVLAIFLKRDNESIFDEYLRSDNIKILAAPMKGLDLIANSDVVISGGGTMVREAVALGVPAYSIFTGRQGAVDERLSREGRLRLIRKPEDVPKIRFNKRDDRTLPVRRNSSVLQFFVNEFIRLAGKSHS